MTMMDGNSGREGSADEEAVSSSYFSTLQQQQQQHQQQQQYQRSTGPQRRQKPFRIKRETFLVLITLMIVIGIGCVSNSKTLKTTQAWYASNRDIVLYAGDNIGVGDDAGSLDGDRDTGTTRHKNNNNTLDAVSTATVTAVTATTAPPPLLSSSSSSSSTIHQQKQQEVHVIEKEETKEDNGEEKKEVKEEEREVAEQRIAKTDNQTTTKTTAPNTAVVLDEEVPSPSLFPSLSDLTRGQSIAHQNHNITCPEPLQPIYDRIIVNDQQQQQQHLIPQSIHMLVSSRCVSKEKIRIANTWMQQFSNYNFYFHDEYAVDSI